MAEPVRAAGGIIRRGGELAVVHRARYDDWTLPKGKAEAAETDEECALREVEEETGFRCAVVREVGVTRYTDARGRPKTVRFFELRVVTGDFAPNDEVDDLLWLAAGDALARLTYDGERELVRALVG
jgi:8-oxo-dGTP diphosphatase